MSTHVSLQRDFPPYRGADASPEDRPGVPREAPPHPLSGAHWVVPDQQPVESPPLVRAGRQRITPVFSTALPPRGLSGSIRRLAMTIPDHRVSHWALLLVADRVDVVENLVPVRLVTGLLSRRRSR